MRPRYLTCDACDHMGADVVREVCPDTGDVSDGCRDREACWARLNAANEAAARERGLTTPYDSDIPF